MMETFTSIDNLNYQQQEDNAAAELKETDTAFYDHIKTQLDSLKKEPSDESISRILAYSRAK